MMEFFCDVLSELFFGICPDETAERMELRAPKTSRWLVSAPGPFVLPAA